MKGKIDKWILFIILSIIWGSSFMLMKQGVSALSPYQVAALRIGSAGVVLIPFFISSFKAIPSKQLWLVFFSGILGSFIPAFLFCIAETYIASNLASILNALTPLFTVVIGMLFFSFKLQSVKKSWGLVIGFIGLVFLLIPQSKMDYQNISFALLGLLATLLYGINVNLVSKHLRQFGSMHIASVAFVLLIIPCCTVLYLTGFFSLSFSNKSIIIATAASCILGILGTALATVLFYNLLKKSGALFASMVTYAIPLVGVLWGCLLGETISPLQIISLFIILFGVYLVNKN